MSIKKLLLYFLLAFTMSTIAANNKVSSREISSIATTLAVESPQAQWGLASTDGSAPTNWEGTGTLTQAMTYANGLNGTAYIQLLANVNTSTTLAFTLGRTAILDLNGYTINRGLTAAIYNGRVIDVYGTLILKDGSTNTVANQGNITGGYNSGGSGGGVNVNGTFIMQGGNIIGNKTIAEGSGGGGVYVTGNFTMTGGSISNNSAKYWGGGVGVYAGSFTMTGGSITSNSTPNGNEGCGGGIYMGSTFTVGGTAVIKDNTNTVGGITSERNVYLNQYSTINVSTITPLSSGALIGVTPSYSPTISYAVSVTGANSVDYSSYFFSDKSSYRIQNSGSGSAQVVKLAVIPPVFDDCHGTIVNVKPTSGPSWETNYTFSGWYTAPNGEGTLLTGSGNNGVNYYAKWTTGSGETLRTVRTTSLDLKSITVDKLFGSTKNGDVYTNANEGWTWYAAETTVEGKTYAANTLVLSGATFNVATANVALILPDAATIIQLADGTTNTFKSGNMTGTYDVVGGIFCDGSLTIKGSGTLSSIAGTNNNTDINADGVFSAGIFTMGDLNISGDVNITAVGNNLTNANTHGGDASLGIYSGGKLTISEGNVEAISENADMSFAISAPTVDILGGNVTAKNGTGISLNAAVYATHNLSIGNSTKRAMIVNATDAENKEITIGVGAIAGNILKMYGSDAVAISFPNDLIVSTNTEISTVATYNNVTVLPGKSLTVTLDGKFSASTLTLLSDVTGTGTFINNGTSNVGIANVQQYLSTEGGRQLYYLSSPVTGATSTGVFGSNKVGCYDESSHAYTSPFVTETPLNKGTGYVVKLATTVTNPTYTFTGSLNDGDVNIPLTRQADTNGKRGFNLVGNPYPSYLDWSAVASDNVMSTIWTRSYNGSAMHFVTYNATYDITLPDVATDINGKYIAPMQAFWVKVPMEKEGQSDLTLDFTNAIRCNATAGSSILRAPALNTKSAMPLLRLNLSNGMNNDQTVLVFSNVASNDYDAYDSPKMSNETASIPELYTMVNGETLAINGMSDIPAKLALGFRSKESNTFSINASEVKNFAADMQIILQDNLLNSEFDLTYGASYTFNSDATDNTGRFNIIFRDQKTPTNIIVINDSSPIKAYSLNGEIIVEGVANELLEIYNSLGQKVSNGGLPTGVYVVKVCNKTAKVIVR